MKEPRVTPKSVPTEKKSKSPRSATKRSPSAERSSNEPETVATRIANLKPLEGSPEPTKQRHARQKQFIKLVINSSPNLGKPPLVVSEKSDPPPYSSTRKSPSPSLSASSSGSPFSVPVTDTKVSPQSTCDREDCLGNDTSKQEAENWSIQNPLKQLGTVKYCENGKEAETLREALEKLTWSITDKIINQVADKFLTMYKLQCEPIQDAIDRLGDRVCFLEDCIVELGGRRQHECGNPRITTRREAHEIHRECSLDDAFCESDDLLLASSQMGMNVVSPRDVKENEYGPRDTYDYMTAVSLESSRTYREAPIPHHHRTFHEYASGESRSA